MKPLRKTLGFVIMKRKIYDKLLQWKREKNGATALMIEGARRVGKSYIAREFARNEYDSFILIDFSKAPQRVRGWFDEYLEDIDTLLQNIQLHYKKKLATRKSLIIFDEVQKCPKAREAIKALVEDGRFDYLETGSLISIKKNVENIVIPSEEDGIDMYPMDFEEFLWAMGNEVLMPYIRKQFEKCKPMGDFHREALHYFRQYLIVGGMPQAVAEYAASRDCTKVDAIQRQILRLYKNDIKKYAGGLTARVSAIYDAIPGQLQKKEKQFTLTALKDEARMREYDSAFFWLDDAKLVNICYNTTAPNIGLQLNEDRTTLKCYFCDTGLLISLAFSARGIVTNEIYQKLMFDKLEIDEGMLVENIVAQISEIVKKQSPYSDIPKLPELLKKFSDVYSDILDEQLKPVLDSVYDSQKRVFDVLNTKEYAETKRSSYSALFDEITNAAKGCTNVSVLRSYSDRAETLKIRLLNEMTQTDQNIALKKAEEVRKRLEAQAKEVGNVDQAQIEAEVQKKVEKVKKTKNVSIKSITKTASWRLENTEDVDKYLNELRLKLVSELDTDTIVNIEF